MCKFKIGDVVICISENSKNGVGVIEGQQYTILDITVCRCGEYNVDVGVYVTGINNNRVITICNKCNNFLPEGVWWFNETRFIKLDNGLQESISSFIKIFNKNEIEAL